jgi:dihydrofolate reductase
MKDVKNKTKDFKKLPPLGGGGASVSIIVAASNNNAIGFQNKLLWHLPTDMKFFKSTTWAMPVIMGRKTFESMGSKPLNGRMNIVITRQTDWKADGVTTATDINDAIAKAKTSNCKEIFIAGGGEIYTQSMDIADVIYMTRVHTKIEGDTFFPEIDTNKWQLESNQDFYMDEKHLFDYSFEKYKKAP